MGRKRKYERILKKLEREIRKRRRRHSSSSDATEKSFENSCEIDEYQYSHTETNKEVLPNTTSPTNEEVIELITEDEQGVPPTNLTAEIDDNKNESEPVPLEQLDNEVLLLLGDAPREESAAGKNVHPDIAARLLHVLENGLKKDQKDKIIEEYPIPGNCQLFKAPILNPEVKAAVSDVLLKKDSSLASRQGQLGIALSALTHAIDILVTEKSDKNQTLLKHISNASRLLCDSHFIDTKLRRSFLISSLNNKLKETLKESKRDKHLFGEALPENLKATKAITKSSQDLKPYIAKPKTVTRNTRNNPPTNNLNWKHPQPNMQNLNRKTIVPAHRTAGFSSASHRNETTSSSRRAPAVRAHRNSAHYKNPRKH